ncbi:MAG TPA: hypothetical protein VFI62_03370 [Burkholderiales bacterium]|nr:hypothetical protein [Burkholderiales bacterium]
MSDRRNRPPNRWGCKPDGDVCVEHDTPLICPHGCDTVKHHKCKATEEVQASLDAYDRRVTTPPR